MFMDTHCHLDALAFASDLEGVLARSRSAGIGRWLVSGVEPGGWAQQRDLCRQHAGMHWAAGLHPWWVKEAGLLDTSSFETQLGACFEGESPALAVGEIGLDRSRGRTQTIQLQKKWFRLQLGFARRRNLPVVLHVVRAHGAALEILDLVGLPERGGVVHGFSGSAESAAEYLRRGLHLGISSRASRASAGALRDLSAKIPADRLLLETDAPDQAAEGPDIRNEPAMLWRLAEDLGRVRDEKPEALLEESTRNAEALFGLDSRVRAV